MTVKLGNDRRKLRGFRGQNEITGFLRNGFIAYKTEKFEKFLLLTMTEDTVISIPVVTKWQHSESYLPNNGQQVFILFACFNIFFQIVRNYFSDYTFLCYKYLAVKTYFIYAY